jgi:hypothetical protein
VAPHLAAIRKPAKYPHNLRAVKVRYSDVEVGAVERVYNGPSGLVAFGRRWARSCLRRSATAR